MAVDQKATLAFLHELSEAAMTAARSGDPMLANRLGANVALQHYFNNVHTIPAMRPDVWAQNFPYYLAEADRIRVAHDAGEQQEARMSAIETQLARLAEAVTALAQAHEHEPARSKRGKKIVEAEPEPEATEEPEQGEEPEIAEEPEQGEPVEDENEVE